MKNKIGYAAMSVVIAFALWLYVITSVSPGSEETYDNIPVVFSGETVLQQDRGLMVTSISSDTVAVKLSGFSWIIPFPSRETLPIMRLSLSPKILATSM